MSVPQTVAEVLSKHVVLEVESIDRMYLNVYVPQLQAVEGTLKFIRIHRGHKVASTHMVEPITRQFVSSIERFAKDNGIPLITFEKGQRKDDFAKQQRKDFRHREGVVFIAKAQEKCTVYRTEKRRNPKTKRTYPWIVKSTALVNHYYFYCVDEDFGPFFLKFCSYFPYNAKLCLNGHEYLKQQLKQRGIAYQPLENGILSCQHPQTLQPLCDRLSEGKIDALLRKWLRRLPHPFAARDRQAGYRYQLSILQLELSLTQILDRPVSGRIFFEDVIRENLDIGRPKQIQLIFDRPIIKTTPGPFRTRVITDGVIPSLHIDYKGTRIKQYHKEGRALRTETTINNTYDFYIGKNLRNLPALRRIGFQANRRLLQVQRISHDCILAEETFQTLNRPLQVASQPTSALRFRRPSNTSPLAHPPIVPTSSQRFFQPRSSPTLRGFTRATTREPLPRPNELSPAPSSPPWDHRTHPPNSSLSHYQSRPTHHLVLHTNLQPHPRSRTRDSIARPFPTQLLASSLLR